MTRLVVVHDKLENLRQNTDRAQELQMFLASEVEDAFSARAQQEAIWRENFRVYEAIPKQAVRNTPIENASNLEVPVGMLSVDIFNSIHLQTLFGQSPLVTAKQVPGKNSGENVVKSMQAFIDWTIRHEMDPETAAENHTLDNTQHGTGIYYVPWIENIRKTKVSTITSAHPKIFSWPIEDCIVPGGAYDEVDELRWIGLRGFYPPEYLEEMAIRFKWNVSQVVPVGTIGWVRSRREQMARTSSNTKLGHLYEIIDIYVYYDIDGDGIREDLLVTWDRTSKSILNLQFNPYDRRPIEVSRYQRRAYLFYGMGMVEKIRALQQEISDIHNHRNDNMLLANTRIWKARHGSGLPEQIKFWPNRVIKMTNPDDLQPEQMGDIYPSSPQAEQISAQMAEKLTGVNEASGGSRPSNLLSSRTPATTAAIGAQQQASRFAATFKSGRRALTGAIKQGIWRYQERIKANDQDVVNHIQQVLGESQASQIIPILRSENFDESVLIEITATGDRTTKQAEQQALIQLGQILIQYYERVLQLSQIAATPGVPQPVRDIAIKIAEAAGQWVERTMRAFDTIRDPEAFIVKINEEVDQLGALASAQTFQQLQGLLDQADQEQAGQVGPGVDNQ